MADWSLLPKDLLQLICGRLETYFEIIQFRSVCISWWSAVPSSSYRRGLGSKRNLPDLNLFDCDENCVLKKSPAFLFRFQTPFGADYSIVGMSEKDLGKQMLMSPLTSYGYKSKYNVFLNTLSTQIIPLGHCYKLYATVMMHYRKRSRRTSMSVAFLPLNNEEFVVMAGVLKDLMIYRSSDKRWSRVQALYNSYQHMVSFKGKFYVVDESGQGHVFVIEPSSLEVNEIQSVTKSDDESFWERLVVSEEELLLVQRFTSREDDEEHTHNWFRVSKLEEKGQRWVRVNDLEDRMVFLGFDWNFCYPAKKLPGTKGNCIVFKEQCEDVNKIFVYDLGTRKTSYKFTGCSGYKGAFGQNQESMLSCGILTIPDPFNTSYGFII